MSGIGAVMTGDGSASGPTPLTCSISWNGATPVNVAGASGLAQPYNAGGVGPGGLPIGPYYPNIFNRTVNGGVPPYTDNLQLTNDPSGKLSIGQNGAYLTIAYANFALNESESADAIYSVTDNAGATVFASCSGIMITRTS